jgi:hypothetical protein
MDVDSFNRGLIAEWLSKLNPSLCHSISVNSRGAFNWLAPPAIQLHIKAYAALQLFFGNLPSAVGSGVCME